MRRTDRVAWICIVTGPVGGRWTPRYDSMTAWPPFQDVLSIHNKRSLTRLSEDGREALDFGMLVSADGGGTGVSKKVSYTNIKLRFNIISVNWAGLI